MDKKRKRFYQQSQGLTQGVLRLINLRSEEASRTFLMFAFYTASYIGILWLEITAAALFIGEYGANSLPWVYLAGAGMGIGVGFFYSLLQRFLSMRQVIVLTPLLMALPLFMLRVGLNPAFLGAYSIFLMRLWLDALYTLNELNTSITANQIFNIREIKRTYPFISSGVLLADIVSGFSLPFLRQVIGLENVILLAALMLLLGAGILLYLVTTYRQAFPESTRRRTQDKQPNFAARRLKGPLRFYVTLVVIFFAMSQILWFQIDFQYLSQLEQNFDVSQGDIADFLAVFSGILGIVEFTSQWFISGRIVERMGVFSIAMLPPALILGISGFSLLGIIPLFVGGVILRFVDEWLRYTLVAGTAPVLFQPIPDYARGRVQEWVRGFAEPVSTGISGIGILVTIWLCQRFIPGSESTIQQVQNWLFVGAVAICAGVWLLAVIALRSRYLDLLVLSAEKGQLSLSASEMDARTFKRAVIDAMEQSETEADKQSCIQLLAEIDPKNVGDVLAPMLPTLSPSLQRQSLEVMLAHPNPAYLESVRSLLNNPVDPDVFAVALRYIWLTDSELTVQNLRDYLSPNVDAVIRGTAAALMLQRGDSRQKAEATNVLRRMLTNTTHERERLMGCRALEDAVYLQALRLYIPNLLQDRSLRVRCAVLEAIAATHLEEYYAAIIRALYYKATREAAVRALSRIGAEAIPMLMALAEDSRRPQIVRTSAWKALSQIGTDEAWDSLVNHLMSSWGADRRSLLRTLLSSEREDGIDAVAELLGRRGVEELIDQELSFIGQTYAALVDFRPDQEVTQELAILRRALRYQQQDSMERLFLLMRFLYPSAAIQAALFNIQAESAESVARGIEILDNTIDLPKKQIVLSILDPQLSDREKLKLLAESIGYRPMAASQRLRFLLDLRQFISDWTLACCFHLARRARWTVTLEQILYGLQHQVSYVRESALMYLYMASPGVLQELLPTLQQDPDPNLAAQVHGMIRDLRLNQEQGATDPRYSWGRSPQQPLSGPQPLG